MSEEDRERSAESQPSEITVGHGSSTGQGPTGPGRASSMDEFWRSQELDNLHAMKVEEHVENIRENFKNKGVLFDDSTRDDWAALLLRFKEKHKTVSILKNSPEPIRKQIGLILAVADPLSGGSKAVKKKDIPVDPTPEGRELYGIAEQVAGTWKKEVKKDYLMKQSIEDRKRVAKSGRRTA